MSRIDTHMLNSTADHYRVGATSIFGTSKSVVEGPLHRRTILAEPDHVGLFASRHALALGVELELVRKPVDFTCKEGEENHYPPTKTCFHPIHFVQTFLCAFQSLRWHSTEQYLTA